MLGMSKSSGHISRVTKEHVRVKAAYCLGYVVSDVKCEKEKLEKNFPFFFLAMR